ncbi:MAG: DUF4230 domain-containing protein [Muribaculaceae bacterium]|nr:DUF4230 domain-containing protein [Muribaculaceae bacterium]
MKVVNTLRWLTILAVVVLAGVAAAWWYFSPEANRFTMHEAKISDLKPMVRLCSMDIYEDVPIKGHIGPRHIFARAALNGTVTFDLEQLKSEERGDTLIVTLPPEIVEIYESTEPGAYKVIDTWNENFFGSNHFTTEEENTIKSKVRDNFRKKVYAKGYVKRARAEARQNLTDMLGGLTGKRVIVNDPTPEGRYR